MFENVRVFNGTSDRLSAPSNELVVGNVTTAMSTAPIAAPPGITRTRIQGGGRTLESLEAKAVEEARRMLLRGFTAARDVGGPVFGIKRAIDQRKNVGPRIYPSGAMISQTSGHGDFRMSEDRSRRFGGHMTTGKLMDIGFIADGRDEVLTATREDLRAGANQIKVMACGGAASA